MVRPVTSIIVARRPFGKFCLAAVIEIVPSDGFGKTTIPLLILFSSETLVQGLTVRLNAFVLVQPVRVWVAVTVYTVVLVGLTMAKLLIIGPGSQV